MFVNQLGHFPTLNLVDFCVLTETTLCLNQHTRYFFKLLTNVAVMKENRYSTVDELSMYGLIGNV